MIKFKPYPVLTLATIAGLALLLWLGKWQLDRLDWKLDLIAAAESRSKAPPVPVLSLVGRPAADIEYTHASADGEFLSTETYQFSQLDDERMGFEVITPLRLPDGRVLLVDRGFVPAEIKDPAKRADSVPKGTVHVTGLIRAAQKPGVFTPAPDLANKVWYGRDIDAIAAAERIPSVLPFVLALDAGEGQGAYPEGGHTRLTFRNDHLSYALTWFGLAGVLLIMYLVYHAKRGRFGFRRGE